MVQTGLIDLKITSETIERKFFRTIDLEYYRQTHSTDNYLSWSKLNEDKKYIQFPRMDIRVRLAFALHGGTE